VIVAYVSMIIPTRNRLKSLRRAIASLQELDFSNDHCELFAIDNNYTDNT
jgi:glycosyltransferase involved in cell wall biosynthesis